MSFKWYNDGVKEYQVFDGDPILEHWKKGRIKRICYTNGEVTVRILPSETPPPGFVLGRAPVHISKEVEQQRRQKLRLALNNRTLEQKQAIADKIRSTKQDRYGSSGFNNIKKRKATCLEKYGDENYSNRELFVRTLSERSEEDKQKSNTKRSITVKQFYQNASPETKKRISDAHKGRKTSNETKERLRSAWTEDKISAMLEKYSNTCQEKYGVPYFCMSEKCRQSSTSNSGPNKRFSDILKSNQISYSTEFYIDHYSFDFKINNNLVEIDPFATHNSTWSPFGESTKKDKYYHKNKSDTAKEYGYRCIHVWDWDDIDKIIMLLKQRDKVYARKCEIKEVSVIDAKEYLNTYHLQNYIKSDINIGLYYNDTLVSLMTFGKPRYNKNYQYELLRYCSSHYVIGGAEKLFNYFVKTHSPTSIISYCDNSKFNGDVYSKLGFILKSCGISKHWYNPKTEKHITDNLLRQRGFDQLFNENYGKGTSNEELMISHGFVEIYDAGQSTYVWSKNE